MACKSSKSRNKDDDAIGLDGQEIPQSGNFRYFGSIIHKDGEIKEGLNHRIRAGWAKWRSAIGVLCDCRIPTKLRENSIGLI